LTVFNYADYSKTQTILQQTHNTDNKSIRLSLTNTLIHQFKLLNHYIIKIKTKPYFFLKPFHNQTIIENNNKEGGTYLLFNPS